MKMERLRKALSLSVALLLVSTLLVLALPAPAEDELDEGRHASCSYGIVAERAMYFEYNSAVGGHCSLGVGDN